MKKKSKQDKIDQRVRKDIVSDLMRLEAALKKLFGQAFNTSEIDNAINTLTNYSETGKWGYEISELMIPIEINRHLKPATLKGENCLLSISVKVKGSTTAWYKDIASEYFDELNFDVSFSSNQESNDFEYNTQFHIDKVRQNDSSEEMHPIFHVHYNNESGVIGSKEKRCLNTDLPRLAHHPVELILGTILVIANYNSPKFEEIKDNGYWVGLSRSYMTKIVYPYYKKITEILEKGGDEKSEYVPYLTI
jgi:hypothetical protein